MNASMTASQPIIRLERVDKSYISDDLTVEVLHEVSLAIWPGEFVAIMGQSGSGKSTLMNLIGCLDRPTNGRLLLNGQDISELDHDGLAALRRLVFGFIFQQYNLLPTASAEENVEMPAMYAGHAKNVRLTRARDLLATLGLGDRLHHRPSQLSGGQQQRVAIARALINGGQVILADEPTGALDSRGGRDILALLHRLNAEGHTIILITHDANVAAEARRVITIADGRIVSDANRAESTKEDPATQTDQSRKRGGHVIDVHETIKIALHALKANLFRTVLTLLGIIIGVGSVVAMLALGDGAKEEVLGRIQAMGSNLLLVRSGAPNMRGSGGQVATLIPDDAVEIAKIPNVRHAVPEMNGAVTLRIGGNDSQSPATATTADFPMARDWATDKGIFFSAEDVKSYAPVIVLGKTVRENLFGADSDPVGRYLVVNNIPFLVIGVLSSKGATPFGNDMDDAVFVPLTTGGLRLFGQRFLRSINVEVEDISQIDATQEAITQLLTARHKTVDFQVRNMASILDTVTETQNTMTILLGSIAAISLLVGGIGVMNIMLVSVTERTREIGIRMAVGARRGDIMTQFLVEALVVCLLGGILGVAGGVLSAWIATRFNVPARFTATPVAMAFGFAVATGLIFGFMPARKASHLDPVVALADK
ncbi:Macrolide transport system ATP-binding/permease [Candidatus Magnetaquicoccaceae bacterium FCR-1]|uniref:Macrolide transport system ATP-binding/permease n=1 Tax=Candidatus Magnetaquiglobus chichijimensis TaxID=3141448 RepID=A0ABQ0CBK1_9PROT